MKKLFIITGEYSGDKHAADVVREIKRINPEIEICAVGGENLKKEGVKLFSDHSKMSAMGFNLKIILNHITLGRRVAEYLKNEYKPDLVLMIDYGGFNLNLSKVISKYGFKIYYYIPPQIWASRKWRLNTVKKCIDKVLTIFPFEKEMYEKEGIDVEFVGHPLLAEMPEKTDKKIFYNIEGLDINKKLVSIFPGSRNFEVKNLLILFLESAKILHQKYPDIQFVICQAPSIKDDKIIPALNKYKDLNIKVLKNRNYELLSTSDALILASGTVALEAAMYSTPMIISYRGPWFLYLIYLLVRCIKRVSLPNIISDSDIVPELIQLRAKPRIVAEYIEKILYNKNYTETMVSSLKNVKQELMTTDAAKKVANIITANI